MTQAKPRTRSWNDQDVVDMLSAAAASLRPASAAETGTAPGAAIRWAKSSHADPISLGGGLPDPESLPAAELQAEFDWILQNNPVPALRYGGVLGSDDLRDALGGSPGSYGWGGDGPQPVHPYTRRRRGYRHDLRRVSQSRRCCAGGATVFAGTIRTIRGHNADVVGFSIGEGENLAHNVSVAIDQAHAANKPIKLLFLIPDYQNPVGSVMSESERAELIEICARHRILIVEDSTYTELYFHAPPPPSLFSMAGGEGVLKTGTFSKIIATGLRVGWVQATPNLIDALARMVLRHGRQPTDSRGDRSVHALWPARHTR